MICCSGDGTSVHSTTPAISRLPARPGVVRFAELTISRPRRRPSCRNILGWKTPSAADSGHRIGASRQGGEPRDVAERIGEHAAVDYDDVVAAAGSLETRQCDGLVGVEIQPEAGRHAGMESLVRVEVAELHASPMAATPKAVSPSAPIR